MKMYKDLISRRVIRFLVVCMSVTTILASCKKDKEEVEKVISSEDSIYFMIDDIMQEVYLWYDQLPNDIDIYNYSEPNELMEELRYSEYDRWSSVVDANAFDEMLGSGESNSIGFTVRWNNDATLRVVYVYKESDAATLGLKRGDIIRSVNNISAQNLQNSDYEVLLDGSPGTFTVEYEDDESTIHTITLTKKEITKNAIMHYSIDTVDGHKTGYFVYDGFTEYSESELEEVFTYFQTNEIDELVVDLRYNGGGYVYLAIRLCEMIAPASTLGKKMFTYKFNDILAPAYDTTINFASHDLNLDLSRVFFITSRFTASASEMVINSLKPHMDVQVIGAPTHGKPVGMPTIPFQNYYILPVAFKTINSVGYGDYYSGLAIDQSASEGLAYDWGDPNEPNLMQAYYYIEYGSFDYAKSDISDKLSPALPNIKPNKYSFMILK